MYHERQRMMQCAMHALNNLFQEPWANRELMERLALELGNREAALRSESGLRRLLINPYKSVIPMVGDYDVNVVLEALKLRECRVSLHVVFNAKDPSAFELALARVDWDSASIRGVIVNFVCRSLLWGSWVTHHFYAIVKAKGPGDGDDGLSPGGGEGGAQNAPAGGGGSTKHLECGGGGGVGTGASADGDREGDAGEQTGCSEKLSPSRRRGKYNQAQTRNRTSSNQGSCCGSDGGGAGGAGGAAWYSLDSRIPEPQRLGGTRGLVEHLAWEVREHHGHVFVVGEGAEEVAGVGNDNDGHVGTAEARV
ncbi:unnamed protein product [Ectocarpus sp. 12 AP-2014]